MWASVSPRHESLQVGGLSVLPIGEQPLVRGLDSSTFQLNVSTFCPMYCNALVVTRSDKNGSG